MPSTLRSSLGAHDASRHHNRFDVMADGPPSSGYGSEIERLHGIIAQLMHTAVHDALTGLPNRDFLLERLEHELARDPSDEAEIAVLFVDLDNFKLVNDSLGHDSGDQVLSEMARRIVNCIGPDDIASRFGGDEIVILHPRVSADSGLAIGQRILAVFAESIFLSGKEVVLSASIGMARCRPGAKSAGQLLREADAALYAAKARGRSRLEEFDDALLQRAERRIQVESDLRIALREAQLFVEYQPQVRLKDGRVVGVEALVRWRHPEKGVVPPGEFISVAEDSGLIVKVGRYVLRESCRQLAEWKMRIPDQRLAMTVNVSPRQLADAGFFADLCEILAETGVDPTELCLEITESAMMGATDVVVALLDRIRKLGVYIAIDDFGTEHSSLSRLRDMPAEVLKIDRSFIDGLSREQGDTAVVSSILSLAYAMGKHAIAEGIETPEQAAVLLRMGCEVGQGYFFSRSVAAERIVPLLAATLWQPRAEPALRAASSAEGPLRRGHRYFVDEFLDHIGAPMGARATSAS